MAPTAASLLVAIIAKPSALLILPRVHYGLLILLRSL